MPMNEKLNIHQKILKIADAAGILQKTKSGYNYKYVPEEEIQAKVTAGMQKYKVMLYHSIVPGTLKVEPFSYLKYNAKEKRDVQVNEFIVTADSEYCWVNVEDPTDAYKVPWVLIGQMEDASQAFGAAETYCNRYFLMKSLQLATSEADPDDYRSKQKAAENYEDEKKQKETDEALKIAIKEIVDYGSKLMKMGIKKEEIYKAVAKYNDGNENPSSIKNIEVCSAISKEFAKMEKDLTPAPVEKKTTKKGEQK